MTNVNGDFLAPAGLHFVYIGNRDPDASEDVCRRLADPEARGKDWVLPLDRDFAGRGHAAAAQAHDFFESGVHVVESSFIIKPLAGRLAAASMNHRDEKHRFNAPQTRRKRSLLAARNAKEFPILYTNIDLPKKRLELFEKDTDYRRNVVRALAGNP